MDPSLNPLLSCVERLTVQLNALRHHVDKGPAADFDPDLVLARSLKELEHFIQAVYEPRTREPPVRFPTRYTNLEGIRVKYGNLANKVAPYFLLTDPLADEADAQLTQLGPPGRGSKVFKTALAQGIRAVPDAPPALRFLFAQLEDVPLWLDWRLLELGCQTHQRGGIISGIVLATGCLPLAYRSAAGNKALVLTGRLLERSIRRMQETNLFFIDTCTPGGLRPYAAGWKRTVEIRMMHAAMRRWLRRQQRYPWQEDAWGAPINQMDMAATSLLFSVSLVRQVRKLGFNITSAETQGVMHLWRYSGYLLGIAPDLLTTTETEGGKLLDMLLDIAGESDPHSRDLTRVLMEAALPALAAAAFPRLFRAGNFFCKEKMNKHVSRFCYGLSQSMLGDTVAAELEYPSTAWRYATPLLLRPLITVVEFCRRLVPGGTRLAARLGFNRLKQMMRNMARAGANPKDSSHAR
jgi:hypothetical protein